jgi:hypothetical protein
MSVDVGPDGSRAQMCGVSPREDLPIELGNGMNTSESQLELKSLETGRLINRGSLKSCNEIGGKPKRRDFPSRFRRHDLYLSILRASAGRESFELTYVYCLF